MSGPLSGIRVLDLSRVFSGPICTQMLGDLGADIVKIEPRETGEDARVWGPPFLKDADGGDTNQGSYFLAANRNKRAITVDLATPEGQDVVRRLAAKSDILVQNFKVGSLAKYGLGHDDLMGENPRLIYCSITGFGQSGPYAARMGYDFVIQGLAGTMSITGEGDGMPMRVGIPVADITTGLHATIAVLAALHHREVTGEGQHIDLAMFDSQVSLLSNQAIAYFLTDTLPKRWGNAHPTVVPYQVFATADGHVVLGVGNDGQFSRFCAAAGLDAFATDERYATAAARVGNRESLVPEIARTMLGRTTEAWVARLAEAQVPCSPINDLGDVFSDPQTRARDMVIELPHRATPGELVRLVGNPLNFSRTPVTYRRGPPVVGQDTDEVLRELLDMGDDDIAALRAAKAI